MSAFTAVAHAEATQNGSQTLEWRTIEKFPGWQVSSDGRVREAANGRVKAAAWNNRAGMLSISIDGHTLSVATVVANAFLGKRLPQQVVKYKDFDPANCSVDNIYYGVRAPNRRAVEPALAAQIKELGPKYDTNVIARTLKVSAHTVNRVLCGDSEHKDKPTIASSSVRVLAIDIGDFYDALGRPDNFFKALGEILDDEAEAARVQNCVIQSDEIRKLREEMHEAETKAKELRLKIASMSRGL